MFKRIAISVRSTSCKVIYDSIWKSANKLPGHILAEVKKEI